MAAGHSAIERHTFIQTSKILKHSINPFVTVISMRARNVPVQRASRLGANRGDFQPMTGGPAALVALSQLPAPSGAGHEKVIWSW